MSVEHRVEDVGRLLEDLDALLEAGQVPQDRELGQRGARQQLAQEVGAAGRNEPGTTLGLVSVSWPSNTWHY